jgi:hypothetical protein
MADAPADIAKRIAEGYAFSGPALELGSVVLDNTAYPDAKVRIPLGVPNRHGLIAGATGTGKTKTLQALAEQLSANGVPVVVADIKGDLSGLAQPGAANDKITARAKDTGDDWQPSAYPVEFLALGVLGTGVPVRATMTAFGPLLLSKILDLNETQESSLGLIFHYADTAGLALLDLKDLRALIQFLTSDEGKADLEGIGGLSRQTAGVILRELITLSNNGGDVFFGEPEWETSDLIRTTSDGKGIISAIELSTVQDKPGCSPPFSCGCSQICSMNCPRSAIPRSRNWCSSSTRRTCCSPVPRRPSWSKSPRPSGSSGPRASASSTSRRSRPTSRTRSSARQPGAARAARLHPGRCDQPRQGRPDVPEDR